MTDRFGYTRGDDERYGRVGDPERYRVVVDAAFGLIDELVDVHGATREDVAPGDLGGVQAAGDAVRLTTTTGTTIVITPTTFPGVLVRIGTQPRRAFPVCGCDACHEDPAALVDQLRSEILVAAGAEDPPTH